MKLKDIYKFLDEIAPFETAESWDNSGLLLGDMEQEFSQIVLSLDLSSEVMQKAPNGSLIVTHHPFLFSSIKKIDFETSHGKLVKEAIKKDISIVAMHTNYDKSVLNRYFAENILGLQVVSCDGFVCKCEVDCEFEEILELVRNSLKIKNINFVAPQKSKVKTIGITTGSGSEMIFSSNCDVFMTGDIKYHTAFDAKERNVALIDITHYASEQCFADSLAKILKILPIEVIITNSKNPIEHY